MRHPSDSELALFAGGELPLWPRLRMRRHLGGCDECAAKAEQFRSLREWTLSEQDELPAGVHWDSLAAEMRANIRVGLAAGECVDVRPARPVIPRWRMAAMALPVLLVVVAAVILQVVVPHGQAPPAPPQIASADAVILEAGGSGIGIESEGRGFRLLTPRENVVYSVRQDAVRARYLDAESGQVMISHVYAQ